MIRHIRQHLEARSLNRPTNNNQTFETYIQKRGNHIKFSIVRIQICVCDCTRIPITRKDEDCYALDS